MLNILEEFAYGNIRTEVRHSSANSEMGQAMRAAAANEKKLLEKLSGAEKEIFEKYMEAQSEINRLNAVENLIHGYKLGLLMTAEAFVTSGELIAGVE